MLVPALTKVLANKKAQTIADVAGPKAAALKGVVQAMGWNSKIALMNLQKICIFENSGCLKWPVPLLLILSCSYWMSLLQV